MNSMKNNQSGFASIIIAMVLILVLSLMTVGFAQLMQREQRSALDKQLSSQAYYAAESGINDAMAAINKGFDTSKTTCAPYNSPGSPNTSSLDGASQNPASNYLTNNLVGTNTAAKYTCLLINTTPRFIRGSLDVGLSPQVYEISAVDSSGNPQPINVLNISWQATTGDDQFFGGTNASCDAGANPKLPPAGSTYAGDTGVIEAEVIPNNNSSVSRQSLIDDAMTFYLCPTSNKDYNAANPAGTYAPALFNPLINNGFNTGYMLGGSCQSPSPGGNGTQPYYCKSSIDFGLPNSYPDSIFVILRSLYVDSSFNLTVDSGSNTSPSDIANSVVLIDSTGQAQDTLRRIQVEAPLQASYPVPGGSLGLNSICKQVEAAPTPSSSTTPGGASACNPNLQY
jgi:Tfp pilus assembly protein PilX